MKINLVLLLVILLQLSCSSKKSELERSWILVENREKPDAELIPIFMEIVLE